VALALTVDVAHYSRRERPMLSRYQPPTRRLTSTPQRQWLASLTWDSMDRIKELAGLPFMLKGVQTAEDAEIAVAHGVDYIWVSNHGGRQIDHGLGSLDTLPEIVQAVNGRARIIVDGGVQRGSDILKSIALGADVVALGRLQGWGLAAGSVAGAVRMLEILEDELTSAMGLTGLQSVEQVTSKYVCRTEPVTDAHEMSSWVNMPVSRIL
jgi:isopentenyl diphosphate isomerase/L-lactate dehydrogenase-like FMN-dependent dehydrogenase